MNINISGIGALIFFLFVNLITSSHKTFFIFFFLISRKVLSTVLDCTFPFVQYRNKNYNYQRIWNFANYKSFEWINLKLYIILKKIALFHKKNPFIEDKCFLNLIVYDMFWIVHLLYHVVRIDNTYANTE